MMILLGIAELRSYFEEAKSVMYQRLKSQGLICLQLILKSQGWEWLTVTIFPVVFDRLATTTEHGICR